MQPSAELLSLVDKISASVSGDFAQPLRFGELPANPFVGLRPFESEEDMLFFGRREQTIELLQQLHTSRFLAVVGSSGSGKSSLIRAGLIPKLKAGFLVDQRDKWRIAVMRPGESPLHNLALAVQMARDSEASNNNIGKLASSIRTEGASALIKRLSPLFLQRDVNLLLLVDQFEEIFRFGAYAATDEQTGSEADLVKRRDDASEFVSIMLELAKHPNLPVYVVMTMRSDFLGDCDAFFGLPEAMNRSQYLVPRLTRQQRQESIEKPILLFNKKIAPRLLDRVLNDTGEEPDQLPIMQHALMRTWDEWIGAPSGQLDLQHYEAAGTMADALWKDAEKALAETGEPELTKRVFQLLTTTDQHGRRIRRPAYLREIEQVTSTDRDKLMMIIECFRRDNRSFLTLSGGANETEVMVDISHESLIRQWKTLRDWVDEEAESRAMYLRLAEAAARYQTGKEGLWSNPALRLALDWRAQKKPNEAWGQRYHPEYKAAMAFLNKSRQRNRFKQMLYWALGILCVMLLAIVGLVRLRSSQGEAIAKARLDASEHARFEAETQRSRAVAAQSEANREREAAIAAKSIAEEKGKELAAQLDITQKARADAERQRKLAEAAKAEADEQRKIAELNGRKLADQLAITEAALAKEKEANEKTREVVLAGLKPEAAALAAKLIDQAKERGIVVSLVAGYRSLKDQKALRDLFLQGRGNLAAAFSIHNTGLAFDVAVVKDGRSIRTGPEFDTLGAIGEELGLVWGDKIKEKWHFETSNAREELRKLIASANQG